MYGIGYGYAGGGGIGNPGGVGSNIWGMYVASAGVARIFLDSDSGRGYFASTISGTQLISTVATGTAPLTVTSTTVVPNLNVSYLQGYQTATANTVSTIVARDGSGNFSAGTITASLTGAASLNVLKAGDTMTGQLISTLANSATTGGGQLYLNGATGNRIDFNTNGVAAPAFTTRSAGTKIVLYPTNTPATQVDAGFGIESGTLWSSVFDSASQFKWYAGTTNIATLFGTGELVLGTTTKTGTASQPLQVTGGAYISGSLGLGKTPIAKFDIGLTGTTNIATTTITKVTDFGTSASFGFGGLTNNNDGVFFGMGAGGGNGIPAGIGFMREASGWNTALAFYTNNVTSGPNSTNAMQEKVRIDSSGNLGIGTASPAENLHIHNPNTSLAVIRLSGSAASQTPFNIRQGIVGTSNAGFSIYDVNNSATRFAINSSGNIGIGTNDPTYKLHVVGSFGATTKSFIIDHPTKEGKKLQYGSLEGPELGVYVRGRTQESIIELPDYWTGLVHEETITVNITAIGNKNIWVEKIEDNKVYINSKNKIDCFYTIFGERKDVDKLEVEM